MKEFHASYQEARARRDHPIIKCGWGCYSENLNAETLFGYPSVTIAYDKGDAEIFIESFLVLPQGVLHITERRIYFTKPECTDIEPPAVEIVRHYRWGEPPASGG